MNLQNSNQKLPSLRFKEFVGDWEEQRLFELFSEVNEKVGSRKVNTYSITAGLGFVSQKEKFGRDISGTQNEKYVLLRSGQFSYNKGNSKTYKYGCVYLNGLNSDIAVPNVFISFELIKIHLISRFYAKLFEAHKLDRGLRKIISSTARMDGLLNVNKKDFFKLKIFAPTAPEEQQKIASFIFKIDEWLKILKQQSLELEQFKKSIVRKIFSQEIRFKQDDGKEFADWEIKYLGELFTERNERNGRQTSKLLSVSKNNGVTPQDIAIKRDNSSLDKSNYKVVLSNDIVYNTMRMWQGASGVSEYDGIVSPAYTVVKLNKGNPYFFAYLFKLPRTVFNFYRYSQGLTSDTWNLKFKHFSEILVSIPTDINEQNKIADFIISLDKIIEVKNKQILVIEEWKKGVLQKILI